MRELWEKQEAIERQRRRLDALIEAGNGIDDEKLIRANRRLDKLIEEYIELQSCLNLERV